MLTPPDTAPDVAQGSVGWLQCDGHAPNGELLFLLALWHVYSVLQPNLASTTICMLSQLVEPGTLFSEHNMLASAWPPSHPHVPDLTLMSSSHWQQANIGCIQWLCDSFSRMAQTWAVPSTDAAAAAWGTSSGPSGGVVVPGACVPPDADLSERALRLDRACARTRGGPSGGVNGSTIGRALASVRLGLLETWTCMPVRACADNATDSAGSDPDMEPQAHDHPSSSWTPHEARGVGVIIKALAQQNAGASLFLRTVACVVALLCFVHSIIVLGERPSSSHK